MIRTPAPVPAVVGWQIATVTAIKQETYRVKTFTFSLPNWIRHRAGQHYDIRLTAPDGYQAQRSYSVASEPEREGEIDLTVELIEDGEVSTYMHEVLVPGDLVELRGPIGGYFVWDADRTEPLLLVAGGSGIVPLMCMIRHRAAAGSRVPVRLLYSVRSWDDLIYQEELERRRAQGDGGGLEVFYTFTRVQPPGWRGYSRRVDPDMLLEVARPLGSSLEAYVCGPTLMVEAVADALVRIGLPPAGVRTERFGPSGPVTGGQR
ncbi:MAG: ferredoxin reductase [Anaerolineae bacterium]